MERLLMLAAPVAVVTLVLSRSRLFQPLRRWLKPRSWFFSELIGCTFCTSVWVATAAVAAFSNNNLRTMIAEVFVIAGMAAPMMWIVYNAHSGVGSSNDESED